MAGQEQTIEATIQAIVPQGNGWVEVQTDQGPFTTKFPEPIAEAQAHLGQRVGISYEMGEASQGRNGVWYPARRYFKRVASPGYVQPQQIPQQQYGAQPAQQSYAPPPTPDQGPSPADRDMRIMRQTAAKCAVWTMQLVPSEQRTFQNQLAVSEAWLRYFIGGIEATGLSLGPPAPTQEQQMAMVGGPDDGIPF